MSAKSKGQQTSSNLHSRCFIPTWFDPKTALMLLATTAQGNFSSGAKVMVKPELGIWHDDRHGIVISQKPRAEVDT